MVSQDLSYTELLLLKSLEAYKVGKNEEAQLYLEKLLSSKDGLMMIEPNIFYIKVLMAKRNWSLNQLRENEKKISEQIAFVRQNLIPSLDEKQRNLFSSLSMEFVKDFTSLVAHIEWLSEDDYDGTFYDEDGYYTNLKNIYFQ